MVWRQGGGGFLVVCQESDVEFFADYSDMESHDGDQEMTEQVRHCDH